MVSLLDPSFHRVTDRRSTKQVSAPGIYSLSAATWTYFNGLDTTSCAWTARRRQRGYCHGGARHTELRVQRRATPPPRCILSCAAHSHACSWYFRGCPYVHSSALVRTSLGAKALLLARMPAA